MKFILLLIFITSSCAHLRDKAHKIYVGTAINNWYLTEAKYNSISAQEFNFVTAEYEMKWDPIEVNRGQTNYDMAEKIMAFAKQNNMKVRGHALVWHEALPNWVKALENNGAELKKAMLEHIDKAAGHFKGRVYCWDVVNEVFDEDGQLRRQSLWTKNFGKGFIYDAFWRAHTVDPNAKLYINDYNVEGKNAKSDGLYNLVKQLKADGVPIHGVGFQSHFAVGQVPGDLQANLQRFADLGVEVAITELDIMAKTPGSQATFDQQAKDFAYAFNACLNVNKCVGVSVWGVTDKYTPVRDLHPGYDNPNMYDKNYNAKSAYWAVDKVIR